MEGHRVCRYVQNLKSWTKNISSMCTWPSGLRTSGTVSAVYSTHLAGLVRVQSFLPKSCPTNASEFSLLSQRLRLQMQGVPAFGSRSPPVPRGVCTPGSAARQGGVPGSPVRGATPYGMKGWFGVLVLGLRAEVRAIAPRLGAPERSRRLEGLGALGTHAVWLPASPSLAQTGPICSAPD